MAFTLIDQGFNQAWIRGGRAHVPFLAHARRALVETSGILLTEVKGIMPVKTGRAKAGWGRYSAGDLVSPNPDASAGDAIWEDKGMEILQGTSVPYVEDLNSGSSRQAPAGFLDVLADKASEYLMAHIYRKSYEDIF